MRSMRMSLAAFSLTIKSAAAHLKLSLCLLSPPAPVSFSLIKLSLCLLSQPLGFIWAGGSLRKRQETLAVVCCCVCCRELYGWWESEETVKETDSFLSSNSNWCTSCCCEANACKPNILHALPTLQTIYESCLLHQHEGGLHASRKRLNNCRQSYSRNPYLS